MVTQREPTEVRTVIVSDNGEELFFQEYPTYQEATDLIANLTASAISTHGADAVQAPDAETVSYVKPNGTRITHYIRHNSTYEAI